MSNMEDFLLGTLWGVNNFCFFAVFSTFYFFRDVQFVVSDKFLCIHLRENLHFSLRVHWNGVVDLQYRFPKGNKRAICFFVGDSRFLFENF